MVSFAALSSYKNFIDKKYIDDGWGGLAAMLVALPSSIAFGVTIFLPMGPGLAAQGALAGIVGATLLGLVAASIGGSQRLITAPCAPAAAMLSAVALELTRQGLPVESVLLRIGLIGLFAGMFQIGLGLSKIGRLIKFIPYPVVSGYLSGVGLIIIGSQIPKFLGVSGNVGMIHALTSPSLWTWQSILVGLVVIAAMFGTPRLVRSIPPAIVALVSGVLTYLFFGMFNHDLLVATGNPLLIGPIETGDGGLGGAVMRRWEAFAVLDFNSIVSVLVPSLTLAALLSIDTLKTCVVLDAISSSHHNPNRALIGQGIGNITSAMFGGVPGAGTMGPSLINVTSGGKTQASGILAGVFCCITYLVLSPLIAWVPVAALAAILMVVGFRMIDRHSLMFFFTKDTRLDFAVIMAVILVALFGNLIAASGTGVALAILLFVREQTKSSIVRHRIEGHDIFAKRASNAQEIERLERDGSEAVVFELQGSLFFGTAGQLQAALEPEADKRKYVILSMRRVQSLDVTATHVLEQIKERLDANDACLVFCDIPKGLPSGLKMKKFLKETGVVKPSGRAVAFRQMEEALDWVNAQERARGLEGAPLIETIALDLGEMPIFKGQSKDSLAALEAVMTKRTVKAGKKLFKAGAVGDELYLIRSGSVKVLLPIHKKQNYHLATCGPGEVLGGIGFLKSQGHTADGVALLDTEVYVLHRADFDKLVEDHRKLAFAVVEAVADTLASRLRATVLEVQALRD